MRLPVIILLASVLLACDSYPIPVEAPCDAVSESGTDTSSETGSSDASLDTGTEDTSGALGCCYCVGEALECADWLVSAEECKAYAMATGITAQWCDEWCVLNC
jgi:hypothetical protein